MIYLDNGATSWPKPACVATEMSRFLAEDAENHGRSGHRMAVAAEKMLDDVRAKLTKLVEGDDYQRMIFTMNCTDSLNIAIKGVLREGDHAITTTLEHNSVSRPLQAMADAGFIGLTRVPMSDGGFVDPDAIRSAIKPNTRLIACTHCSNVLGTIQPAEAIGRIAREHDALFLLDAAQSIGVIPVSVRQMHIDLLAFPGHKALLGPTGTGGLYVGNRVDPAPFREGGTGGDSSSPTHPSEYPFRLEGGTPNTVGFAGLGASLDYVVDKGPANMLAHERALLKQLIDALTGDERFTVLGSTDMTRKGGVVSFTVEGMEPAEVGAVLDESFEIAVRPGLHCSPYTHQELGTFPDGSVRVGPGPFTTTDEIDQLIAALQQIVL